jgi:hypothetical protein
MTTVNSTSAIHGNTEYDKMGRCIVEPSKQATSTHTGCYYGIGARPNPSPPSSDCRLGRSAQQATFKRQSLLVRSAQTPQAMKSNVHPTHMYKDIQPIQDRTDRTICKIRNN